jgi:hypothetical protein
LRLRKSLLKLNKNDWKTGVFTRFLQAAKDGKSDPGKQKLDALLGRLGKTLRRCRCLGAGKGEEGGSGGKEYQRRLASWYILLYLLESVLYLTENVVETSARWKLLTTKGRESRPGEGSSFKSLSSQ